jgi:hypothetical protein
MEGCESWSLALKEEQRFRLFADRVRMWIYQGISGRKLMKIAIMKSFMK